MKTIRKKGGKTRSIWYKDKKGKGGIGETEWVTKWRGDGTVRSDKVGEGKGGNKNEKKSDKGKERDEEVEEKY